MMGLMAIGILSQGGGYSGPTEWIYPTAGVYEFTVPVSGNYQLEVIGGGGGGGGIPARTHAASGGGGAGQVMTTTVALQSGVIYTITVGAGGAVSANGESSSFGALLTANGGWSGTVPTQNNQGGDGGRSYNRNNLASFRWGGSGAGGTSPGGVFRSGGGGGSSTDGSGGECLIADAYDRITVGYSVHNSGAGAGVSSDRNYKVTGGTASGGGGGGGRVQYRTITNATNPTVSGGGGGGGARSESATYQATASAGYAGLVKINLIQ